MQAFDKLKILTQYITKVNMQAHGICVASYYITAKYMYMTNSNKKGKHMGKHSNNYLK